MERMRQQLNNNGINVGTGRPPTWRDNMSKEFRNTCPSLSYETRLYGFLIMVVFGSVLSFFGTIFVFIAKYRQFALFYSIGSICGLLSSCFVVGPCRQMSLMFAKSRWIATVIYLSAIGGSLYIALVFKTDRERKTGKDPLKGILCLVCVFVQYLAALWYGLSFIPY